MEVIGHLIGGERVTETARTLPLNNPATGRQEADLAMASSDQTMQAIRAAAEAYPAWRATPPAKRAQVMFRFKALLEAHVDEICALVSRFNVVLKT